MKHLSLKYRKRIGMSSRFGSVGEIGHRGGNRGGGGEAKLTVVIRVLIFGSDADSVALSGESDLVQHGNQ